MTDAMKFSAPTGHAKLALALLVAAILVAAACGGNKSKVPAEGMQADKFLFERGTESLKKGNWIKAREYFQQLYDNYPQSSYRTDAKLGLGDAYLGADNSEALVLAANEFREFLTFFPNNPRADYAQYKLSLSHFAQMLKPDRDQTQTRETIKGLEVFMERYPNSPLRPEAAVKLRAARDRLSEHSFLVGLHYFRVKWYPGAIDRFREVLVKDPEYTKRDALYYYLAECLLKIDRKAEALPYFERLVAEFEKSEFLPKAQLRIKELKG